MENLVTLDAIQSSYPFKSSLLRNLTNFIKAIFEPVGLSGSINGSIKVANVAPKFLESLDVKLWETEQLGDVGKRRLANAIGWRVIASFSDHLPSEIGREFKEFTRKLNGGKEEEHEPATERCVNFISKSMPLAIDAMYINADILKSMQLKREGIKMAKDIKEAVKTLVEEAVWMDNSTNKLALEKIANVYNFVGYSEIVLNNLTLIEEEYKDIIIQPTYFETVCHVERNANLRNLGNLLKTTSRLDPLDSIYDITIVNAFNDLGKNIIVIPASMLMPPYFSLDYPKYRNYGYLGMVVGHEVTHALDSTGSHFDSEGALKSWWSTETSAKYKEKKQGLIDQYNSYSLAVGSVNGRQTIGENIADNGGYKAAYRAFKMSQQRSPGEGSFRLQGLESFSPDMLFFLSAGQAWCGSLSPSLERIKLLTSKHSPLKYRVNGPLSNMPEFGRAFNCTPGTPMNPVNRNGVW